MEKKGETKRQHYVPQMILRRFSKNDATTSLLVLSSGTRVPAAAINRQCYGNYFYGADQIMEKSFRDEESKISKLLGDLSRARIETLTEEEIGDLKFFVHYQNARTLGAATSLSNFLEAFMKTSMRGTARLNNDDDLRTGIENVRIRFKGATNESLWQAGKTAPIVFDLKARFLTTSRSEGFVIGDHPVVAYNQFAEQHPVLKRFPTSTGLALKGLQLFMPLSPDVTLAFYDPTTYEYDGKLVCGAGPRDVRFLNQMQTINAHECVFFDADRIDDAALDGLLAARAKHPPRFEKSVATSDMVERADGGISQFIVVSHVDVKVGAQFSFLRVTDKRSYLDYEGPTIPIRSPDLLRFAELYGQHLEEECARGRDAAANSKTASSNVPPPGDVSALE